MHPRAAALSQSGSGAAGGGWAAQAHGNGSAGGHHEQQPLLLEHLADKLKAETPTSAVVLLSTQGLGGTARLVGMQAFSAVLYGGTSVAMNFVNKFTMKAFPLTNVVVALQMACSWAILASLRDTGVLQFGPFSWQKARQLAGITVLYTGNTVFSLVGLKTLNIPMYNVLKRLTPMIILVFKSAYRRRWPARDVAAAVALVVLGCVVAGLGDLEFDVWGYVYALLSCSFQAAYLLIVEFQGVDHGVGSTEMLYYNSATSLPLLLVLVVLLGEAHALPAAYAKGAAVAGGEAWLCANVLSCALMGMLLNYAQFLCTTTNSALTTTIVGVAKGILAVLLGFFFLGGVPYSPVNVLGVTMNTVGVVWYTVIKFNSRGGKDAEVGGATAGPSGGGGAAAGAEPGSGGKLRAGAAGGPGLA